MQSTEAADNCEVNIHYVHMYMQIVAHLGTVHHTNKPVFCKKKKKRKRNTKNIDTHEFLYNFVLVYNKITLKDVDCFCLHKSLF